MKVSEKEKCAAGEKKYQKWVYKIREISPKSAAGEKKGLFWGRSRKEALDILGSGGGLGEPGGERTVMAAEGG